MIINRIKYFFYLLVLLIMTLNVYSQSNADLFYKRAKEYDANGDSENAIIYYSKTIKTNPKFLNAYFNRGSILASENKYQEALNDFQSFDSINPNDFEVQYLIAACNYYLGKKNISFEFVNKSLNQKKDFFDALKLRGTIYLEDNKYQKAIEDFNRALLIHTNDYDVYFMSGFCYEALNKSNNALKRYFKAEDLGYVNDVLFNNIGSLLSKQNNYYDALTYFDKAISVNDTFALAYYNQGIAYNQLGFKDTALKSCKKAQELGFKNFNNEILILLKQK